MGILKPRFKGGRGPRVVGRAAGGGAGGGRKGGNRGEGNVSLIAELKTTTVVGGDLR